MEWLERATILKVLWGSHAFGTANPDSDVDIRGVCIPPRSYLLGLSTFEQAEDAANDTVIYSLAKFVALALANNPNMLDLLWTNEQHILYIDEYGAALRAHRELFLSRQVAHTYAGYAENQLQRMETHYRWLHQPPTHQPMPEEFGALPHPNGGMRFPNTHQERAYRSANKHWQNYQHWRAHRNPERAATEERYGYDTKHALHLLRLYRMGIEILQEGTVRVYRPDAAWLRQVKEGLYTYPHLMALVAELKEELTAAEANTALPEAPDRQQIDDLLISLHWRALQTGRA
ncbi:MAG: nucleotidyltransferase domain-containing protein [Caldilineaceae bacterium]|nr:nucleotidyltransferase domain-containing protein [Caldilineaceae bacterium]